MRKPINAYSTLPPSPMPKKVFVKDSRMRRKESSSPRERFLKSSKPDMAYLVNVATRAVRDLNILYEQINAESSDAAMKWYLGLTNDILSLEDHPNRCPVIRSRDKLRH